MQSWKTTAVGILMFVGAIIAAATAMLDGNPETVPNWTAIGTTGATAVGLFLARDNDKSSEDVGAN